MSAEAMTKPETSERVRVVRAHVLGLIGANLALGALFLWALPVTERLLHSPAGAGLTVRQLLQPWAEWGREMPVPAEFCAALSLAGIIGGGVLITYAARLLTSCGERR